jgi:hypothetical protein
VEPSDGAPESLAVDETDALTSPLPDALGE